MAIVISIDGCDGCGKSTQISLLRDALENKGLRVLCTKAIGSELHPATEKLRDIALNNSYSISPQAQQLIFAANSFILWEEIIAKNSPNYDIIILDRSYFSFHAYGLPLVKDQTWLRLLSDFIGSNRPPDYTIFLDIDREVGYKRARGRKPEEFSNGGEDVIEAKGLDFQKQVYAIFKYFTQIGGFNIVALDVNNKTIDGAHEAILELPFIKQLMGSNES